MKCSDSLPRSNQYRFCIRCIKLLLHFTLRNLKYEEYRQAVYSLPSATMANIIFRAGLEDPVHVQTTQVILKIQAFLYKRVGSFMISRLIWDVKMFLQKRKNLYCKK